MHRGYIKLWRKLWDNPITKKPAYLSVFLFCLTKANHQDNQIIWNNQKTMIKRGSFITSADKIAEGTGVPRGTVERILKYLENEVMIEEQTTKKFRLISIVNYDQYQPSEEEIEEQLRNNWTSTEEQVDTNKNVKELKRMNKNEKGRFTPPTLEEVKEYIKQNNYPVDAEKWYSHYESNGWMVGKNKMKSWKASVRYWASGNNNQNKKPVILQMPKD